MRLADIDLAATSGASPLHRATPAAKLAAAACVVAAVVVTADALVAVALLLAVLASAVASRLPGRVLAAAAYPVFFALVFAFSAGADLVLGALIVAKAACASLAAVTLVGTTPYPQVFAPIQRVTPAIVGDALLFTYRSFFLLAEKSGRLARAVRVRSGLPHGPLAALKVAAGSLGGLLLYSMDLAQRDYDVMRLRGYDTHLRAPAAPRPEARDAAVVACALLLLAVAITWRLAWATLQPISWAPAALSLLLLGAAFGLRISKREAS